PRGLDDRSKMTRTKVKTSRDTPEYNAVVEGHRMRTLVAVGFSGLVLLAASGVLRAGATIPDWAYAIPQALPAGSAPPAAPVDTSSKQVPGSTLTFTRQQISDGFGPADWFPGDHPVMPEIVARGKRPDVRACGL